ncbi:hypothetical protein M9H77_29651 [Catharanthus roseus]|uniref:Uncharacterized protein n=1 Tax=Catharanthus roseus TaxID=4058 RepID=A0ACB9ZVE9_CATRO|nr:hypothetical protein M9H77_29651 [Catharanthus roseus]
MVQGEKDTRYFNSSTSESVWQDLKETTRSFQSQLSSVERYLGNIESRLEQREYEHAMGGYNENHGYQAYLEEDSYYKFGQSFWNRKQGIEETFKKVMRAIKVLGIPAWMMDIGIFIHMNKKLGTMERKPMNIKRA